MAEEDKDINAGTVIGTEMIIEIGKVTNEVRTAERVMQLAQRQRQQPQQRQQQASKAMASHREQRMREMRWMKASQLREGYERRMMSTTPGQPNPADRQREESHQRLAFHRENHHQAKPIYLLQALFHFNAKLTIMFLQILMTYGMLFTPTQEPLKTYNPMSEIANNESSGASPYRQTSPLKHSDIPANS